MNRAQISAADEQAGKKSFDKFVGWAKQYLASEKDLVFQRAAHSCWVAEVSYDAHTAIAIIDLKLPLHLQTYQLGQQIGKL